MSIVLITGSCGLVGSESVPLTQADLRPRRGEAEGQGG